jgi:hypothetical protein
MFGPNRDPGTSGGIASAGGADLTGKSVNGVKASEFQPRPYSSKSAVVPDLDPGHRANAAFSSRDLSDLMSISSSVREDRIKAGHPRGALGNLENTITKLRGKVVADGTGSGCRDWAEAVAQRINGTEGQRFTAGVICGGLPLIMQHCVTAVYPKGKDPSDPSTSVRYIDAWQADAIETGPIRDFLCSKYGLTAIKQDPQHWAFGANPELFDHTIALYDQEVPRLDDSGKPVIIRGKPQMESKPQINVDLKRTCKTEKR